MPASPGLSFANVTPAQILFILSTVHCTVYRNSLTRISGSSFFFLHPQLARTVQKQTDFLKIFTQSHQLSLTDNRPGQQSISQLLAIVNPNI